MPDALGRHQPAPGDAAGKTRLLGTEDKAAHVRMDAIGADQEVRFRRRTVRESRDHALTRLLQPRELVTDMQTFLRQRVGQKVGKIGAVEVVIRRAEGCFDLRPQRYALQAASIVPAPLMDLARTHTDRIHRRLETQPLQQPRRVGTDLDASADPGDARRLLVDMAVEPRPEAVPAGREPADSAANDCDFHESSFAHFRNRGSRPMTGSCVRPAPPSTKTTLRGRMRWPVIQVPCSNAVPCGLPWPGLRLAGCGPA